MRKLTILNHFLIQSTLEEAQTFEINGRYDPTSPKPRPRG